MYAKIKGYLTKVNINVQQVGRHRADHRLEERTSVNMTPDVSIGSDYH